MPTRRRFLPKVLLVLFGLLFGILVAEGALRIAGYSYPEFYQIDPTRGYALRPNASGWYTKEGEAYVQINSAGLRDGEHSLAKPSGTIRIAVIGDSYPEALNVAQEEAFWSVMERGLRRCGAFSGKPVEVINFGVSGYGTAQELLTLREHVWHYSPDVVMLAVTTNNDISDNSRALRKTLKVPYFVYRDGKLVLDDSFKNHRGYRVENSAFAKIGRWFRDNSRVIHAVLHGHRALRLRWTAPGSVRLGNLEDQQVIARSDELGIDNVVYVATSDPAWQDAWAVTEGLIDLMNQEVKSKGAKFLLVTLSNGPQVYPDTQVRAEFMRRLSVKDIFYPDNRLKALCERLGIAHIILAPELQRYADQNRAFLHGSQHNLGDGHWNATGHRVAGELLAGRFCGGLFPEIAQRGRSD